MKTLDNLKRITVVIPYEDLEQGWKEEIHQIGFLTSDHHAMFLETTESSRRRIVFVEVEPTYDPNVFVSPHGWCGLGELKESDDPAEVVNSLTKKLKSMSAYEFMTDVVIHVKGEIEFEDWMIPKLIN